LGALVQTLRNKKRKPRPDETLLNHLDHIRRNFRNPTDHPDKSYDLDEVQDLFSLVADVLNRIARELPDPSDPFDFLSTSPPEVTSPPAQAVEADTEEEEIPRIEEKEEEDKKEL
jgi:hypothetical protein